MLQTQLDHPGSQALQMTGGAQAVKFGPCDPASWHPDLDWLEAELQGGNPPKMVVLVNPCNPTGAILPWFPRARRQPPIPLPSCLSANPISLI